VKPRFRPRLLALTAIAAGFSILANGAIAVTATTAVPETRLGVSIKKDIDEQSSAAARRARALDLREAAARAAEARLKADVESRTAAASASAARADGGEAGEQYDSLARVYQSMKPARAAAVFEQLDMDVQMQVAKRMRDRSTAAILASMSPAGAAALSMSLARRAVMPRPSVQRAEKPAAAPATKAGDSVPAAPPAAANTTG